MSFCIGYGHPLLDISIVFFLDLLYLWTWLKVNN